MPEVRGAASVTVVFSLLLVYIGKLRRTRPFNEKTCSVKGSVSLQCILNELWLIGLTVKSDLDAGLVPGCG